MEFKSGDYIRFDTGQRLGRVGRGIVTLPNMGTVAYIRLRTISNDPIWIAVQNMSNIKVLDEQEILYYKLQGSLS